MLLPSYWLPRPPFDTGAELNSGLESLYQRLLSGEDLDGALSLPLWQFLCWLADSKGHLLHGSGDGTILEFEPRQSNDVDEFGNRKAVYAASDGIWAMFFAIVDRKSYSMTIVNAAVRLEAPSGEVSEPFYFFSLTDKVLMKQPWREGFVYVLPREGFEEQAPRRAGDYLVHSNQWANLRPVKPLAKFRVRPTDFPFLNRVRGQDDALLAQRAAANPDGFPWVE
jgi:hypothetical protein